MDAFKLLEEKIVSLIDRINDLQHTKIDLEERNIELQSKIKQLEETLMADVQRLDKLDQEKSITKLVVEDLIKSIDSLVEKQ